MDTGVRHPSRQKCSATLKTPPTATTRHMSLSSRPDVIYSPAHVSTTLASSSYTHTCVKSPRGRMAKELGPAVSTVCVHFRQGDQYLSTQTFSRHLPHRQVSSALQCKSSYQVEGISEKDRHNAGRPERKAKRGIICTNIGTCMPGEDSNGVIF